MELTEKWKMGIRVIAKSLADDLIDQWMFLYLKMSQGRIYMHVYMYVSLHTPHVQI